MMYIQGDIESYIPDFASPYAVQQVHTAGLPAAQQYEYCCISLK
jgi:hypothetical protein